MYSGFLPLFGTTCGRLVDENVCELDRGHDGEHLPYTPGTYLPPPTISPLDFLAARRRWPRIVCPLCAAPAQGFRAEGPYRVHRDGNGTTAIYETGPGPGNTECLWQFKPCGCEGREILPSPPTTARDALRQMDADP